LQGTHVWGCPTYVLDPTLQDGKKLPKWKPRSRRGMFVGVSPDHSTNVSEILNLTTLSITPQYHLVYDDFFTTVYCPEENEPPTWPDLLQFHSENVLPFDAIPPPLDEDWLDDEEQTQRAAQRERQPTIDVERQPTIGTPRHTMELGTPRHMGTPVEQSDTIQNANSFGSQSPSTQSPASTTLSESPSTTPELSVSEGVPSTQETFSSPSTSSSTRTLPDTTRTPNSPVRH
ncbi:MAG: hypothetical protein ACREOZ_05270, partial [Gloeomargaritales cyanobacterium]